MNLTARFQHVYENRMKLSVVEMENVFHDSMCAIKSMIVLITPMN